MNELILYTAKLWFEILTKDESKCVVIRNQVRHCTDTFMYLRRKELNVQEELIKSIYTALLEEDIPCALDSIQSLIIYLEERTS